ncbi:MAG: hypothetical protein JNK47_00950 [Mesorhizobium sp.]|nr:hypothetical protein [Mesorhizobium sp.]MBL8575767.1 hypothetical protein [Mesorhizobium sp.]
MSTTTHPAAPLHLPGFITAPGETDVLFVGATIFLIVAILGLGSVYFRLHSLPEKLAHGNASKVQFEVVAVLALLALLTHNNMLWVAALILALVPIPDLHGPLATMAEALARMAGLRRSNAVEPQKEPVTTAPASLGEPVAELAASEPAPAPTLPLRSAEAGA